MMEILKWNGIPIFVSPQRATTFIISEYKKMDKMFSDIITKGDDSLLAYTSEGIEPLVIYKNGKI
jgi:hypothetical protein